MSRGTWVQVEIKRCAGSEAWAIVRHRKGAFRVPLDVPLSEVLTGVSQGWRIAPSSTSAGGTIRVPAAEWASTTAAAARARRQQ